MQIEEILISKKKILEISRISKDETLVNYSQLSQGASCFNDDLLASPRA